MTTNDKNSNHLKNKGIMYSFDDRDMASQNHVLLGRKMTNVCTNSSSTSSTLEERRKFVSLLTVAEAKMNVSVGKTMFGLGSSHPPRVEFEKIYSNSVPVIGKSRRQWTGWSAD